jgi:aminomethyltransferase
MANKTPLFDEHFKLGGTIVDFAGWELPVYYTSVIDEHEATRERAGVFDICHMGEFDISGVGAFDFLQKVLSRNIANLKPGTAMYSTLLYPDGGTVDDLFIYRLEDTRFMMVVNASNIEKDFEWLNAHAAGFDVKLTDMSGDTAKIDLQGPGSKRIVEKIYKGPALPPRFSFAHGSVAGVQTLVSRTGYTGEDGFELYSRSGDAAAIWRAILDAGKPEGVQPCGLGARDSLRLEAAYSLYGHELTDLISPVEAGIRFVLAKDKDYIGSEVVKRQMEEGAPRQIIGLELKDRGVPREHYEVKKDEVKIGELTSGTFSPTLKKGIGMALISKGAASTGDAVSVIIRGKPYEALVVKRPFISYRGGE